MLIKEEIIKVIDFWHEVVKKETLFYRSILEDIDVFSSEVIDIAGPRRSGKSSLLKLIIRKFIDKKDWIYINFEDPFFINNNQPQTIERIIEIFKEFYSAKIKYLFFDEIQNINGWEKAIRKLYESKEYRIFITGSSSKLLGGELSSLITGRHKSYELMPLDFKEWLSFNNIQINTEKELILNKIKLEKYFDAFLKIGGFPKIAVSKDEELLKQYYLDILEKDIIKRHDVRNKAALEKLGIYLLTNSSKTLSVSSLAESLDLSKEIAAEYISYFKEAFLIFDLPQFSYSLKTQQKALKKIYSADTGLSNVVSFRFSEDYGRFLENAVFLHLRKQKGELFYYKTKNNFEVDFLLKKKGMFFLFQVSKNIENDLTKKREIRALLAAMGELKIEKGFIITKSMADTIKIDNKTIEILPAYRWLLTPDLQQ
ncbi:hypothetical protein A3J90_01340 [candidate division WOR-1 bacterium RIFOXYC2_FULL_37_10]|uniref:AAA+ ATPase domain-containing protein n=1 Tax=candidate division WOR-1 bacterium RIFOXYB2_FULL_37_13 TaxID=1802579 RepID=A0A1F4ST06_UNCSA|nr:MAG: hypothetical protein A2310_03005 [candidate division WOR-1 bacterium RIFOXYB2_FULL_37_13]OGC35762.1 MAG: hypothetical protein A3J90_01340 [candidate division WOR-1 bacterium RIFOXYC2_FULL_37_10]